MDEWTEGVLLGIVCGIIVGVFIYAAIDPHNVSEPPQQEWIEEEVCVEWDILELECFLAREIGDYKIDDFTFRKDNLGNLEVCGYGEKCIRKEIQLVRT